MKSMIAISGLLIVAGCSGPSENASAGNEAVAPTANNTQTAAAPQIMPLQAGEWETTVEMLRMEMPGIPGAPPPLPPPTTTRHCLTPELAAKPIDGIMSGGAMPAGCVSENNQVSDGRLQATFSCDQNGMQTRISMDGVFSPTNYQMSMQASGGEGQTVVRTDMRLRARRIGECQTPPGQVSQP